MATGKEFIDCLKEQMSELAEITVRSMMGEYIIYYRGKIAAYVCDDRLLIKPVPAARALMPDSPLEAPYMGAKPMLLCENTDDKVFLTRLFNAIYPELPAPAPKKRKAKP